MAQKQNRMTQLRKDVDRLRKNYTGAMSSANKAVTDGIEKLAEHELAAIKKHYEAALKNLKSLRKGGDPRDLATSQLQLLQDTIDRIIKNARESLKILEQTRNRISADVRKEISGGGTKTTTASKKSSAKRPANRKSPAKKTASAKAPAKKTAARKTAAKKPAAKKAPAKKTASKARKSPAKKTAAKKTTTRKKPAAATTAASGSTASS